MKTLLMLRDMISYVNGGKRVWNTLEVDSDDTVYSVMAKLEEMTGVPPILQRIDFNDKSFYHDTPGTLAENKLLPTYPAHISVSYTHSGSNRLQRDTLRNMGFCVDDDRFPVLKPAYPGQKEMFISVMDYIRMDGGGKEMLMVVEPGDTVASIMEEVQRRRRYPLAMQEVRVCDADRSPPHNERRMDKLDATLADYNVKEDSIIKLYMNMAFAVQADREARGVNKAKEIAAPGEQQKLADDEK